MVDASVVSAALVVWVPVGSVEDSVVVSVVVDVSMLESTASGPAPETTPAETRPAVNNVTMTNET